MGVLCRCAVGRRSSAAPCCRTCFPDAAPILILCIPRGSGATLDTLASCWTGSVSPLLAVTGGRKEGRKEGKVVQSEMTRRRHTRNASYHRSTATRTAENPPPHFFVLGRDANQDGARGAQVSRNTVAVGGGWKPLPQPSTPQWREAQAPPCPTKKTQLPTAEATDAPPRRQHPPVPQPEQPSVAPAHDARTYKTRIVSSVHATSCDGLQDASSNKVVIGAGGM